jgi:hypothetical protein
MAAGQHGHSSSAPDKQDAALPAGARPSADTAQVNPGHPRCGEDVRSGRNADPQAGGLKDHPDLPSGITGHEPSHHRSIFLWNDNGFGENARAGRSVRKPDK